MNPSDRFATSKRVYQETRGKRPNGEWKQRFRQVVSEKAKKHRMDRIRMARTGGSATDTDVLMNDLADKNGFKNNVELWWQEFAEEEGIYELHPEDLEALLAMEEAIYQEELASARLFRQYELQEEWERAALEAQIEAYQNDMEHNNTNM